jgi:anthranilate phosphoribosyltransferase|tara:strand:+ start:4800 stop:5852 length:1053 start_codon:yes stop_codon:yes gene_type:complete
MPELSELKSILNSSGAISAADAKVAALALANESVTLDQKKAFLIALHKAGETVEVVTAFAEVFRELALDPQLGDFASKAVDIVGTGGTGTGGYNVSSATAVIVAACGQPVLKHGNRAITSKSGAADFLGQIGVTPQADPAVLRASVEELNFCFFFAPAFHPAFKSIMPVRLELAKSGQRTIFNILGPLINPAKPKRQLLGVGGKEWVGPLASALTQLGVERGIAAHCVLSDGRGMDELTTAGENVVTGIGDYAALDGQWSAERYGFSASPVSSVIGGTPEANFAAFRAILTGEGDAGLVDTLVLNAGVALHLAEAVDSLEAGFAEARAALSDGRVAKWLDQASNFFAKLA